MIDIIFGDRKQFMGQLATRCYVFTASGGSTSSWMSRTGHYARCEIRDMKIAYCAWYVSTSTFLETGIGGTMTIYASVEYPSGVITPFSWNGATHANIASGTTRFCDLVPVSIPIGALFWIRMFMQGTTAIPYYDSGNGGVPPYGNTTAPIGDALANTATNSYLSGTITDGGNGFQMWPNAIVGHTSSPSIAMWGDSRLPGLGDSVTDATGDRGELGRALGSPPGASGGASVGYPYINFGVPGDLLSNFLPSNTLRLALSKYCTHVISEYGINDLNNSESTATIEADILSAAALLRPRPFYQTTVAPQTSSTDMWKTLGNQTVAANNANRQTLNTWIRSLSGIDGCVEVAGSVESGGVAIPSGKWIVNGTANYATSDGLHETSAANLLISTSNGGLVRPDIIPPGGFASYMPIM
jgi:lysophospholipase L1-like esterase